MARIGDTARLTLLNQPGLRVALADDLEEIARGVWLAARHAVEASNGIVKMRKGRQGVEGQINVRNLVAGLLSEASSDEVSIVAEACRNIFRRTHAAECTDAGKHTRDDPQSSRVTPTWWVADELPADFSIHAAYVRDHGKHAGEIALIQEQARKLRGASRIENSTGATNGPVTSTPSRPALEEPVPASTQFITVTKGTVPDGLNRQHQKQKEAADRARDAIAATLKQASEPLTPDEIFHLTDWSDTNVKAAPTIKDHLAALIEEGRIFRRLEEDADRRARMSAGGLRGGRRAYLYFGSDPVPTRTSPSFLPVKSEQTEADRWAEAVLDLLDRRGPLRAAEVRTALTNMRPSFKLSADQVKTVLDALIDLELVCHDRGRHTYDIRKDEPAQPALTGVVTPPPPAEETPAPVADAPRADKVNTIMALVESLVADSPEAEALREELAVERVKNQNLQNEVIKLQRQVNALKAALVALE